MKSEQRPLGTGAVHSPLWFTERGRPEAAPSWLYRILCPLVAIFYRSAFRITVLGRENIPSTGPALLCCNHISGFDPPLVAALASRPVYSMAKAELFGSFAWFLYRIGVFPVRRGKPDRQSLRTALTLLQNDHVVAIYPEGTRHHAEAVGKPKLGVALLARMSGAPVVPVVVQGPYGFRKKLRLAYGTPRYFSSDEDEAAQILTFLKETMDPAWPH